MGNASRTSRLRRFNPGVFGCVSLLPGGPAWLLPSALQLADRAGWLLALALMP